MNITNRNFINSSANQEQFRVETVNYYKAGVYSITVDNKIYIGKHRTNTIDDGYMGSGLLLKRAIQKYGIQFFTKEILFECKNESEMNRLEESIVDREFVARLDTYNINIGGCGGGCAFLLEDAEFSKDFSKKVSNGLKLYHLEHGHQWLGKHHTDETKRKIGMVTSKAQKGSGNSQYGTRWIHNLDLKISKRIKNTDPIPEGWIVGRKIKFSDN
jgi:hypothetical protein